MDSSLPSQLFQSQDLVLLPLWFSLIIFLAYFWVKTFYQRTTIGQYFIPALIIRLVSGIISGAIAEFYYGGNTDTSGYFSRTMMIKSNFITGIYTLSDCFTFSNSTIAVSEIAFPISYLTNNSYLCISLFFSCLSFIGSWRLFKLFCFFYPHLYKTIAYCTLFLPSVFFWGSGLLKDPLSFSGLGIMLYALYSIIFLKRKIILNIFVLYCAASLVFLIKPYILLAVFPPAILWIATYIGSSVRSSVLRFFILPVLLFLSIGIAFVGINQFTNTDNEKTARFGTGKVLQNIESQQNQYKYYESGGSFVNLGDFEATPVGLIKMLPLAIITTFFRPFPWEIKNILMLFSTLESFLLLYLTIRILFRMGFLATVNHIRKEPFLLFCFIFAISFAGFVASSTFNLGTLARYKIPCLPFFWLVVIVLNDKSDLARIKNRKHKLTKAIKS